MKKIVAFLALFLMVLVMAPSLALAGPSVDQQNTNGQASLAISSKQRMAQRFLPSMTGLSKVDIELANVVGNKKVSLRIRHKTGDIWDDADVANITDQVAINGWNTFDFADVTVIKDGWYGIFVTADAGPQWMYHKGSSTYTRGYAIYDSVEYPDDDFNFKTWGTDPVEIVAEQDISEQQNSTPDAVIPDGQTTGTGTGAAPSTTTSSAIKAASGLKAEYANSAVNLTWTASTTSDIDGYKVFRSETATSGFTEIGKTVKATLKYADSKELVAEKTYYYMVRAYKGTAESASTTIVPMLIPIPTGETEAKVIPFFTDMTKTTDWAQIQLYWILGGIIGILLALLVIHERERVKTTKLLSGRHFRLDK